MSKSNLPTAVHKYITNRRRYYKSVYIFKAHHENKKKFLICVYWICRGWFKGWVEVVVCAGVANRGRD